MLASFTPAWDRLVRGLLVVVLLGAACGARKGLSVRAADASPEVAPAGDASAGDASAGDASAGDASAGDARDVGADQATVLDLGQMPEAASDTAMLADVEAACAPWPVAALPDPMVSSCPPTSAPPACAGDDVGAVVARSEACVQAWGDILFQCVTWQPPADGEEIVVLELGNCTDAVDSVVASACGDHIAMTYVTRGTCQACDGKRSSLRAFTLPRDPRPVIATGRHIEPPCPPFSPDAATATAGAGGAGGSTAAGGAGGGCAQQPVSESQAGQAYAVYVTSSPNPGVSVEAEEKLVPGLWEAMHAQLFTGKIFSAGSSTASSQCSFVYRDCALTMLTENCTWFGPILSGAVKGGTFYYSWGWGSGIYRTTLSKLAPDGTGLVKTHSDPYYNSSSGPPGLVISLEGDQLVVYRATVYWAKFNEWLDPERMGTLADDGDRLTIVDSDGRELPSVLP